MNIAVTGGVGSGKSTVSQLLASYLRCDLLDTDQLCRQQLEPGCEGMKRFEEVFSTRFLHLDGTLNRNRLREATFNDPHVKSQLETVLHPIVREIVLEKLQAQKQSVVSFVVEVPLLYEVQWQDEFDKCIVVYTPEHLVYERVMQRNGLSFTEIELILKAQIPIEEKRKFTPLVIDNSDTFTSSVLQVANLVKQIFSGNGYENHYCSG